MNISLIETSSPASYFSSVTTEFQVEGKSSSNPNPPPGPDTALGLAMLFTVVLNFIGNSCVLVVMNTSMRKTFRTMSVLLTALASADVLHGLFVGIPYSFDLILDGWVVGDILCKMYVFIRAIIGEISVMTLAVIGFERFRSLTKPDSTSVKLKYVYIALSIAWGYVILVGLPYLSVFSDVVRAGQHSCTFMVNSDTYTPFIDVVMSFAKIVNFSLPLLFVFVCYTGILINIRKSGNRVTVHAIGAAITQKRSYQNQQVAKMCIIIMIVFLLLWSPLRVILVVRVVWPSAPVRAYIRYLRLMTLIGSCVNPLIYGVMWKQFRFNLNKMMLPICRSCCGPLADKWLRVDDASVQMSQTDKPKPSTSIQRTTRMNNLATPNQLNNMSTNISTLTLER